MPYKTIKPKCRHCGTVTYPFGSLCDACWDADQAGAQTTSCCGDYHYADCPIRTGGGDHAYTDDDDLYRRWW